MSGKQEHQSDPSSGRMIVTMGTIGLIAGLLIVFTYQLTLPVIQQNKKVALERAIFEVVPGATQKLTYHERGDLLEVLGGDGDDSGARKYYAAYDSTGLLLGIAIEAAGRGFQDILTILYGYSPKCECIVGMKVLESKETPGLGDKIMTDPVFRSNFDALAVPLDDSNTPANPVTMVKRGEKTEAWQVEAITGATISSRAVATILRESTAATVPVIVNSVKTLEKGIQ